MSAPESATEAATMSKPSVPENATEAATMPAAPEGAGTGGNILSTPTKREVPSGSSAQSTPSTPSTPAFRITPPPDPTTPGKIGEKLSYFAVVMDRVKKRHKEQADDILLLQREVRRLEAVTKQHNYRQVCADRRRNLDEISIMLDEEVENMI